MKGSKYSKEKIARAIRKAEQGTSIAEVCQQLGVSRDTFYVWKKKYADWGVPKRRDLQQLEQENAQLKRLIGDLTLSKHILTEVVRKKA